MSIQDKIKYINNSLGFAYSGYGLGGSSGSVGYTLLERGIIDKNLQEKINNLGKQCNFWENYYRDEKLNTYSILFINLVYKLLKK